MGPDETIVVGGGIAGLMCAVTLTAACRPVTVLEAVADLGGRGATSDWNGYRLNLGGHALYWPDEQRLRVVGVRVSGGHHRPDRGCVLHGRELSPWPLPPRVARSPLCTSGAAIRTAGSRRCGHP
jgi:protoporphyrinogen oxidase